MKNVKKALQDKGADEAEIKDFETKAQGFAKKIISNFKDYDFLIGESMNPDGMYVHQRPSLTYDLLIFAGLSSSTTARTAQLPSSPSGSTA